MKCNKCNHMIDNDSKYCAYCGASQTVKTKNKSSRNATKKAPSDGKIALIVIGIIGALFLFLVLSIIFFITVVVQEDDNKIQSPSVHTEQKYEGKTPILQRNYKQANTVTTNGFAEIDASQAIVYLKNMGFSTIETSKSSFGGNCVNEVTAKNFPYQNVYDRDRIDICFDASGKISELKVEFIFTASDFNYEKAKTEVINASRNFHNFTLNQTLMKESFNELRQDMRKFEKFPSADREETIGGYEFNYNFEYDDERSYSPAKYTVELEIERDN